MLYACMCMLYVAARLEARVVGGLEGLREGASVDRDGAARDGREGHLRVDACVCMRRDGAARDGREGHLQIVRGG